MNARRKLAGGGMDLTIGKGNRFAALSISSLLSRFAEADIFKAIAPWQEGRLLSPGEADLLYKELCGCERYLKIHVKPGHRNYR